MKEDLLSAYLDDELDVATRERVEARLAESGEWRSILDEVRATRDALRALPVRSAPPGFWDRLRQPEVVSLDDHRAARTRRSRLAAAGAVAAAVVIGAVALVPLREQTQPPVATFADAHAARSSLSDEPLSQLAGVGQSAGLRQP
jgi:anti-sigma factor RsiW